MPISDFLLAGRREELRWQLGMLEVRDTPEFLIGSMLHYGTVSDELLKTARQILDEVPVQDGSDDKVDPNGVRDRAQEELEVYRRRDPSLEAELRQEDD